MSRTSLRLFDKIGQRRQPSSSSIAVTLSVLLYPWITHKGVFKGGWFKPTRNFLIFLKSEGKEVERRKMDGGGGNC